MNEKNPTRRAALAIGAATVAAAHLAPDAALAAVGASDAGNKLVQDPRIDPRIKAVYGNFPPTRFPDVPNREAGLEWDRQDQAKAKGQPSIMRRPTVDYEAVVPSTGLAIRTEHVVSSPDGNTINLLTMVPEGPGPWPCVYYIHGGGMIISSCYDASFQAWGRQLAHAGVAVVMVDFRNALRPSSVPEIAPFPAGLNDCVSGLRWLRTNTARLNVDPNRIIVAGESGGGNLSVATALKLKRDGDLRIIRGVFVMCPYLAGAWPLEPGSSALLNDGILMGAHSNFNQMVYGMEAFQQRNPLAWPGFAAEADVTGFPPVVINVNECDPLRDDGVKLYRLLLRSGVTADCRMIMGTVHATETNVTMCPEISRQAARDIAGFCRDVSRPAVPAA